MNRFLNTFFRGYTKFGARGGAMSSVKNQKNFNANGGHTWLPIAGIAFAAYFVHISFKKRKYRYKAMRKFSSCTMRAIGRLEHRIKTLEKKVDQVKKKTDDL